MNNNFPALPWSPGHTAQSKNHIPAISAGIFLFPESYNISMPLPTKKFAEI